MIFVVEVILKMGLPVLMADNEGFREWLAMLNPKFQNIERLCKPAGDTIGSTFFHNCSRMFTFIA